VGAGWTSTSKARAEIVYVKDNPGRHLLRGEPLPPFGWGWFVGGCVFLVLFIVAMKLR
jgi:hypothetical protein